MAGPPTRDRLVFSGRKIAIVGCARGFGRTLASEIGAAGAKLFLFDKDLGARDYAAEIQRAGGDARFFPMDVLDTARFPAVFSEALGNSDLDGVIYMPRAREERDFRKLTRSGWDNDINVALTGAFFAVQALLPYLEKKPGTDRFVMFMSSILSELVGLESVSYHVAKAGLDHLTRYLAANLGPTGIRVNSVQIGIVIKDEGRDFYDSEGNAMVKRAFTESHPLKRAGSAEDILNSVAFLASPLSSFITGQCLCLDGGVTLQEQVHFLNQVTRSLQSPAGSR